MYLQWTLQSDQCRVKEDISAVSSACRWSILVVKSETPLLPMIRRKREDTVMLLCSSKTYPESFGHCEINNYLLKNLGYTFLTVI